LLWFKIIPGGNTDSIKSRLRIYELLKETQEPISMALFNVGVLEFSGKRSSRCLLCDVISGRNLLHVVTKTLGWPTSYLLLIDYV
jgi:hypothetical protein